MDPVRTFLVGLVTLSTLLVGSADARERPVVGKVVSGSAGLATVKADVLPPVQPGTFPGERPSDSRMRAEVALAVAFWRARGVTGCPDGIAAYTARSFPFDPMAIAVGTTCETWVLESFIRDNRDGKELRSAWSWAQELTIVAHEVGHALGLEHSEYYGGADFGPLPVALARPDAFGLMTEGVLSVPREFKRWARRRARTPSSRRAASGSGQRCCPTKP